MGVEISLFYIDFDPHRHIHALKVTKFGTILPIFKKIREYTFDNNLFLIVNTFAFRQIFLKNVCYIKHFYVSLHPIRYNYGKEYIRKNDAESPDTAVAAHG